jgi:hypothetical protein
MLVQQLVKEEEYRKCKSQTMNAIVWLHCSKKLSYIYHGRDVVIPYYSLRPILNDTFAKKKLSHNT